MTKILKKKKKKKKKKLKFLILNEIAFRQIKVFNKII